MIAPGYSSLFSMGLFATHDASPAVPTPILAAAPETSYFTLTPSPPRTAAAKPAPPKIHINTQLTAFPPLPHPPSSYSAHPHSANATTVTNNSTGNGTGTVFPRRNSAAATPVTPTRPRLRKRRSSLSVAVAGPMGAVKSPSRAAERAAAGAALSFGRIGGALMGSPSKRGGVGNEGNGRTEEVEKGGEGFMARLRGASAFGGALRSRRANPPRKALPACAAPTAPLPPPPSQPSIFTRSQTRTGILTDSISFSPNVIFDSVPSIPSRSSSPSPSPILPHASSVVPAGTSYFNSATVEFGDGYNASINSNAYLTPDFALQLVMAMQTPPASPLELPVQLPDAMEF